MNRFNPFRRRREGPPAEEGSTGRLASWLASLQPRQRLAVLIGAPLLVVLIVVGAVVGVLATTGGGDEEQAVAKTTATPSSAEPIAAGLLQEKLTELKQLAEEELARRQEMAGISGTNPDAPAPGGEGDRLIIPAIDVDAPLTLRVVTDGVMQNPDGPEDVAWYDFSALPGLGGRPGIGGNTVLSGHVDYHDYGTAVFWDLRKLEPGAEIIIHLSDGSEYSYSVEWNRVVDPASAAWNEIVAETPQESLTIITCAGTFDSATRSYDQRRVVWAVRVS
jgi:LPXTG-site transpeptidase (sortase) family protein